MHITIIIAGAALGLTAKAALIDLNLSLSKRDTNSCGADGLINSCGTGIPSNWCCPTGYNCLRLNNTVSLTTLCCPKGQTCTTIQTISCDASLQNADQFPESSIHTQNTSVALQTCGSQCCPLGYGCNTGSQVAFCQILDSTLAPPKTSSNTTGTLPASTTIPTNISTSTSNSTTASSSASASSSSSSSKGAIIGGVIVGLAVLALIVLGVWYLRRQHNKKTRISEPIYDPQRSARTVFVTAPPSRRRPDTSESGNPLQSGSAPPGERAEMSEDHNNNNDNRMTVLPDFLEPQVGNEPPLPNTTLLSTVTGKGNLVPGPLRISQRPQIETEYSPIEPYSATSQFQEPEIANRKFPTSITNADKMDSTAKINMWATAPPGQRTRHESNIPPMSAVSSRYSQATAHMSRNPFGSSTPPPVPIIPFNVHNERKFSPPPQTTMSSQGRPFTPPQNNGMGSIAQKANHDLLLPNTKYNPGSYGRR